MGVMVSFPSFRSAMPLFRNFGLEKVMLNLEDQNPKEVNNYFDFMDLGIFLLSNFIS